MLAKIKFIIKYQSKALESPLSWEKNQQINDACNLVFLTEYFTI